MAMNERELLLDCLKRLNALPDALDLQYMRKWADELGLGEDLERIVRGEIRPKAT
jgi:hypothetical protein